MSSIRALFTRVLGLFVLCVAMLTTGTSHAQNHPSFDRALKLMRDSKFEEACPLLETALAAEGTMIVRFRLAECYEQIGKLASALNAYQVVAGEAALSNMKDREAFAKKKAAELEPRVPRLKLIIPPEVGAITGLQITVDGKAIHRTDWGHGVLLDLGPHALAVAGPDYETWTLDFSLESEREVRSVQVPNRTIATSTPPPPSPNQPQPLPDSGDDAGGGMSALAIAGIVVLGVGVVLTGVSIGVGVDAKSQYDDTLDGCTDTDCPPGRQPAQRDAESQANIATALFIVGVAAAAGGALMWILAPSEDDVAFGVGPGGAVLRGTF